jgi:hypothetical protein
MIMHNRNLQEEPSWGIRINRRGVYRAKDCPRWANPLQREKWGKRGIILWDYESHQVTRLSATQALKVLNYLCSNDDWKHQGVIVGESATRLSIDDPTQEPEQVLVDQMELVPTQVQELFDLLQNNESMLKELSEQEHKERGEALRQVYNTLLGEEVWSLLGKLYEMRPEDALELAQEPVVKRLSTL